jgi:hypothetical protein
MNNLRPIAQAVRSQGRNQDTQLVHMTPREVAGLQALAMAHGGSLSINPNTGLPEAGFLSDILPAVAGFALGPAGFGLMSSGMAGLAVGGLTALTSGDLGKGVMAGLGAWGGSSLGEGLLGAGQAAVGGQAAANATTAAAAQGKAGIGAVANAARESAIQEATKSQILQEGTKSALSNPAAFMDTMGGFGKTATALGAASTPLLLSQQTATKMPEQKRTPTTVAELQYRRQVAQPRRDPNDTSEQNWFTGPGYVKVGETTYGAEGGAIGYAQGGAPVTGGRRAILSNEEYLNQYFSPVQTATQMPGVRKASGGIVSLADGGLSNYGPYSSGYKPMTPEEFSKMYFGQSATPTGLPGGVSGYEGRRNYTPPTGAQTPSTPGTGGQSDILVDAEGKKYRLEFDPATGTYRKIYEAETPAAPVAGTGAGAGVNIAGSGGDSAGSTGPNYYEKMEADLRADMKDKGIDPALIDDRVKEALLAEQVAQRGKIPEMFGKLAKAFVVPGGLLSLMKGDETTAPVMPGQPVGYERTEDGGVREVPGVPFNDVPTPSGQTYDPFGNAVTVGPAPAPNPFAGPTYDEFGVNAPVFETVYTERMTPSQANAHIGGGDSGGGDSGGGAPNTDAAGNSFGDVGFDAGDMGHAQGGLLSLAAGGMAKGGFVVPADVVSALGNGSTDAGLRTLQAKLGAIKPIKGKGDGLSDSIPTHIDGKQPARVADGEAYIDPKTVAKIGGGDMKKGASKLYAMMDKIRKAAHGKTTQQRKVNPAKVVKA